MFKKRSDAVLVKDIDEIEKAGPFFMPSRIEAQNLYVNPVRCEALDEFIAREKRNGNTFTYTHFVIASLVRLYYLRPRLNYFISHNVFYEHKDISVCMVIKKALTDKGEEVTLKIPFTGRENIFEVKEKIDKAIAENIGYDAEKYETTKTAGSLNKLPNWIFRLFMRIARFLDRHNCLPKSLIKASPFHTSVFVTNLKSLKLDAIHHHLYEFGTCSLFIAMGKEKMTPVVEGNKEIQLGKVMNLGVTMDERVADGFYYGKTLKIWNDMFANPDCLKEGMPEDGSKKMVIKKRKKKSAKIKKEKSAKSKTPMKQKSVKSRSRSKKSKEQLEKLKILKKQIKEEKEELREKIKIQKQAYKDETKKN